MIDLGFVKPGSTVRIPFGSYTGSTGASSAASNLADADIQVYKDGGTTQRASASGMVATTSYDSITGINLISIDLADNTTAGFWSAGSEYVVVINPFTIDSQTVALSLARFVIGLDAAVLNTTIATLSSQTSFTLTLGPAEDDALNGCVVYIHDVASAVQGGFAVVNDYTGSTKTVTLTAGVTFTAAATDNVSIFPPSNERWVGTQLASAAAGVTYPATIASTTNITAGTITTTTNLTNLPAITAGWLTATGIASDAITAAKIATDAISSAQVAAAAVTKIQAGLATPTNITAGTITTVTNLTNAPTVGDLTATMKTSIGTAVAASAVASVTGNIGGNVTGSVGSVVGAVGSVAGAVGSVTGNVGGNVTGSVGSILSVTFPANFGVLSITAVTGLVDITQTAADKAWGTAARVLTAGTNIALAKGVGLTGLNDIAAADVWAVGARTITGGTIGTITGLTISGLENMQTRWLGMVVIDGAVYKYTAKSLELAPGGGAGIAQAVWDLATSGIVTVGSIGEFVLGLNAGAGSGAFTVTVTVTDGTDPLQNANIRLIEGVTPYTATTNASGVATFALDAATYSIAITKAGYQFTPSTIVVTAAGNFDKAMTARVIPPSANPDVCRVGAWVQTNSGLPLEGVFMFAKRTGTDPASAGALIEAAEVTSILPSDDDGFVFIDLILPSEITPAALEYTIRIPAVNYNKPVTPEGATFEIELP